jgi:hypothetical protein
MLSSAVNQQKRVAFGRTKLYIFIYNPMLYAAQEESKGSKQRGRN